MNGKKYLIHKRYAAMIALFCSLLWGSAFPVLKISYEELKIAPGDINARIVLAGIRFLMASVLLFLFLKLVIRHTLKPGKKVLLRLLVLGLFQTSLQYYFFYNGLALTSGMKAAVLNSSGIFFMVLAAHFVYSDDRMNWRKAFGLVTGFMGICLVNWKSGGGFSLEFSFRGEGFLLLSGLASTYGTILAKKLSKEINPFLITAWQMLAGSILLIGVGLPGLHAGSFTFTTKALVLLIYSAFLSAVAFSLWFALLKYNKAGEIVLYKFMIPVSGAILSALLIPGESLTKYIAGAVALVSVGIVAVNYRERI